MDTRFRGYDSAGENRFICGTLKHYKIYGFIITTESILPVRPSRL